jgi:hypothetical protein
MLRMRCCSYSSGEVLFCPSVEYGVAGKVFEISFPSGLYVACKSKFHKSYSAFVFNVVRSSAACEIKANALETSNETSNFFPPDSIKMDWTFPFSRMSAVIFKLDPSSQYQASQYFTQNWFDQTSSNVVYSFFQQEWSPVSCFGCRDAGCNLKDCNMAWNKFDAASR